MRSQPAYKEALDDAAGTLSDRVYRHLAERLVAGRFAPGDKLSLRAVAEALGLSIMPVREAISRLAAERALEVLPKRAVTVPLMQASQFRDITRVRVEIEGIAAAMAAHNNDPALRQDIAYCEAQFRALSRKPGPDLAAAVAANQAFHFSVYRAAGSPELLAIIERLWLRVGPIINLDLRENPERLKLGEAVRFHAAAAAAIQAGDAEATRAAIAGDIRGASEFILSRGRLPA
ncbi:MAG: GntR family transcriptional regulator [Beijerinckiaceae bacterium]